MFLVFRARLQTLNCRLNEAIRTYEHAIHCQSDWKNLHHIAYWEILWCHVLQRQWKEAINTAQILLTENNWSKATSCYLLATFQFEDNNAVATNEIILLYKRVPELKIRLAGKSIPLEKYAIKQCEHFLVQKWLFLPALELVYLMNGFYILAHDHNKLQETLNIVNNALKDLELNHQNDQFYADSYGSGLLLRGVLFHFLHRYDEAHQDFDEIINMTKQFDEKSLLPPNAVFEKAMIYLDLKQKQKTNEYLQKSINDYKDYQLESRLHFRINAAMQTVKQMDNDLNKKTIFINKKRIDYLLTLLESLNFDLIYLAWLWTLFKPLCLLLLSLFLLPAAILLFVYGSSLFCLIYKHWNRLKVGETAYSDDLWYGALKTLAILWELQGNIWHGYEVEGLEHIPTKGPVLIVFYHGALPIDFYYLFAKVWLYRNRRVRVVADKFVFKIPGLGTLLEALGSQPATSGICKSMLEEGHVLAISPGGVREALFSDHNYRLIWKERRGFAKVAIESKATIIPMFTKNCREAACALTVGRRVLRYIYEKTRLPIVPIYGIFPVKLITYLGEPIPYDPDVTTEILAVQVKKEIEKLIEIHQRRPGSITQAILDRFSWFPMKRMKTKIE
ncbi:unnamed protein product [Rotaria sp. Silwood1]|nr:unnamed protein product [Rotaria sp. Silwood1]